MYAIIVSIILCVLARTNARIIDGYNTIRTKLLEKELELQVGGNLQLSDEEIIANDIIMRLKREEVGESFEYKHFDFSRHYFMYKNEINNSLVYQIIKKMPKGAALHVHSSLMLSADRLLDLTYEEHLYICLGDNDLELQFSIYVPLRPCPYKWQLLSELRNTTENVDEFDSELKKHFTLYSEDEKDTKYDINLIWSKFNKVGRNIVSLISYRPVREKFFYYALKEFYDDNIMYLEIRSGLAPLYELNGTVHDIMHLPHLYYQVAEKFKKDYSDFIGVKLIVTRSRSKDKDKIIDAIKSARVLKNELPDFFAGFDLVGQEDLGKPLLDFRSILEDVNDMNFYFHGGETNWFGTSSDENLIDAILLGSKRIGHGYALIKHPSLMATVREKDIAIEVNVISNVVLSLLCDIRNHPLATYLALGMPVVLSSDDPGAWGADPLSHDFYVAFVGVASKRADLRMLKQLVINSIKYSALDDRGKTAMFSQLTDKWNKFIKDIIENYRRGT